MERESFESEAVARVLNEHFVSIKVDREERPDVDKVYMTFVQVRGLLHITGLMHHHLNMCTISIPYYPPPSPLSPPPPPPLPRPLRAVVGGR